MKISLRGGTKELENGFCSMVIFVAGWKDRTYLIGFYGVQAFVGAAAK